jgi:hypothetical protein
MEKYTIDIYLVYVDYCMYGEPTGFIRGIHVNRIVAVTGHTVQDTQYSTYSTYCTCLGRVSALIKN